MERNQMRSSHRQPSTRNFQHRQPSHRQPITISHGNDIYRNCQLVPSQVQQNIPARDYNSLLPSFQLVEDTLILQDTTELWFESEDFTSYTAVAEVDVPDETIEANINIRIHASSNAVSSSEEHDICVVCQDVYKNKEKIGALKCGHEYHVECIKKWLRKKNMCPICKATALP